MKDVDAESLGDAPGPTRVGVSRHSLVHHARRTQCQRAVDDVGVAGDPTDIGEAPVGVLGVDVLVVLRGACYVRQIAARAVLTTLGSARRAACVH